MSRAAAGRTLLEATHALVKAREPDLPEFEAVCKALAGYFQASTGLPVSVDMKVNATMEELQELLKQAG